MNKLNIVISQLLMLAIFASCSDDDNNNNNPTPEESYYPLTEKTMLTYRDDFAGNIDEYTYGFLDKTTINDKEYMRFVRSDDGTFSYLRVAGNGDVYEYTTQFEREYLICKASLKTGDVWKNGDDGFLDFQVGETGMTAVVAGKTYNDVAKVYWLDANGNFDDDNPFFLYARGVGRIYSQLTSTNTVSLISYSH
jgi:hypothetical protein